MLESVVGEDGEMAFQSNQVTWQPPEGLSNSRPRLVRPEVVVASFWHASEGFS